MSGPAHLPLVAWSRQQLLNELWKHELAETNIRKEIARRGDRDELRHGFPVPIHAPGMITTAYRHFATAAEAYDAAREAATTPGEKEEAPYHVHPIYLGKDDPATPPQVSGEGR